MKEIGSEIAALEKSVGELDEKIRDFVCRLPNMPDEDVVAGGKEANVVLRSFGEKPSFDFEPLDHIALCDKLGIVDYERGAKLAGAGFWIYSGIGAQLEYALINFFISRHIKNGYSLMMVPHMLNYACGFGAGQFPKFAGDVYWLESENEADRRFMLPTAETALVNLHAGEILDESELPKKYCAYTPCFRREAGGYGSAERGMIRGHQFNKVEMVQYAHPEHSREAFEEMVGHAEALLRELGLHYQVTKLAAEDCSASMARTYDVEVWIPSMDTYKEVSSVSNANDYQARRMNAKFRDPKTGKPAFLHTLNGSGLATSRVIPALLEQCQNADGSVTIPKVLVPFMGGIEKLNPIK